MKKPLLLACTFLLFFTSAFAQTDSNASQLRFILKVNPTLMITSGAMGEIGASLEVNVGKNLGVSIGYGYNTTTPVYNPEVSASGYALSPSTGNTIRAGAYYFLEKRYFFSLQFFYRTWQPTNIYIYNYANVTTSYVTGTLGNGINSDQSGSLSYTVNNSTVNVTALDILFGRQYMTHPNEGGPHFFFEWFVGLGSRILSINNTEYGYYHDNYFFPDSPPVNTISTISRVDFKLGIQFGVAF
jgi:hypothetical protein